MLAIIIPNDADFVKHGNTITITLNSGECSIHHLPEEEPRLSEGFRVPFTKRAKEIHDLRMQGLTQKQVADKLGTTQANVSRIEMALKKLAKAE